MFFGWLRKKNEKEKNEEFDYFLKEHETETGRGYVVVSSDGQRLNWRTLPVSEGLESIPVVGESFRLENLQKPCFKTGSKIQLIPEPDNPYDKNAIAVYDISGKYQAGYIPSTDNKRILKKIEKGEIKSCIVMWENFKDGKRISIRLLLIGSKAKIKLPTV